MQASLHIARAGAGQGANGVLGRRVLRAVRLACNQGRRRLFLEEGELELFKANGVARLPEPLCHVLRGTILADSAGGTVAAARGGNLLQRLQMPERALANRVVGQVSGRRATDDVIRPGYPAHGSCEQDGSETDTQARSSRFRC